MKTEILKKIIAEWIEEKVLPPLIKRDAPDLALDRVSEIIAVAGPRRAGKTWYLYQLIQDLLGQGNRRREDIRFMDFEDSRLRSSPPPTWTVCWSPSSRSPGKRRRFSFSTRFRNCAAGAGFCGPSTTRAATVSSSRAATPVFWYGKSRRNCAADAEASSFCPFPSRNSSAFTGSPMTSGPC